MTIRKYLKTATRAALPAIPILLMMGGVPNAHAKSAYLIGNHTTRAFDAWNINPGPVPAKGTVTKQATNSLIIGAPGDVGIHDTTGVLFITGETSSTQFEIYDPTSLTSLGTFTGLGRQFAGIEVNETTGANRIYAAQRRSPNLFEFSFDPTTNSVAHIGTHVLKNGLGQNLGGMMGIGYDDANQVLYVADGYTDGADSFNRHVVGYDVNNFAASTAPVFEKTDWGEGPLQTPVDITVDSARGKVYTVSTNFGAATPPGAGDTRLVEYDIATGITTNHALDTSTGISDGVGVAVDEATGFVYVTAVGGNRNGKFQVYDPVSTPGTLVKIDEQNINGSPGGIAIASTSISFNPLNLAISKDVVVQPGDRETVTITYDNIGNAVAVDGLTLSALLPLNELAFVSGSASGGTCSHNAGTGELSCSLPTLAAGASASLTFDADVIAGLGANWQLSATIAGTSLATTTTSFDQRTLTTQAPEPPTVAALGLGLVAAFAARRRRNRSEQRAA